MGRSIMTKLTLFSRSPQPSHPLTVKWTALATLIVAGVSLSARPTGQVPFRARTDLVQVPVTVRDASGRVVLTLSRDDFVVKEDGHTKTLVAFDPPSANNSQSNSAP